MPTDAAARVDEDAAGEAAIAAEQTWSHAGESLRSVNTSEKAMEQKQRELQRQDLLFPLTNDADFLA